MIIQFSIPATGDCAPCCNTCPDVETLDAVIAGTIEDCGCTIQSGGSVQYVSSTDIFGSFTLNRVEPPSFGDAQWSGVIGTATFHTYTDAACSDDEDTVVSDVTLTATCTAGVWNIVITTIAILTFTAYAWDGEDPLDTPEDNQYDCSTLPSISAFSITGSVTLSL